jgi:hypothetical protein
MKIFALITLGMILLWWIWGLVIKNKSCDKK